MVQYLKTIIRFLHLVQTGDNIKVDITTINHSNAVPTLYLMIKDHKLVIQGKLPSVRTVVSSNMGMGVHMANNVSEITEAVANCCEGGFEAISTEDAASRMDD